MHFSESSLEEADSIKESDQDSIEHFPRSIAKKIAPRMPKKETSRFWKLQRNSVEYFLRSIVEKIAPKRKNVEERHLNLLKTPKKHRNLL